MTNTSNYDDLRRLHQDGRSYDQSSSPDTNWWQPSTFEQYYDDERFQYNPGSPLFIPPSHPGRVNDHNLHPQASVQQPGQQAGHQISHQRSQLHNAPLHNPLHPPLHVPQHPVSQPARPPAYYDDMANPRRYVISSLLATHISKESSPDDFLTYFDFAAHESTPGTPKDPNLGNGLAKPETQPQKPAAQRKKPTFIPLDNLDNKLLLRFKEPIASSHSDSSFDVEDTLKIQEPDLEGFNPGDDDRFHRFQTDTTPLMKPPTSIQDDYFDFYDAPLDRKSSNSSKEMANNTSSDQEYIQFPHDLDTLEPLPFRPPEFHHENYDHESIPSKLYISHLDIERPSFNRTDSNQSNASLSSLGSNKDVIKKKKPGKGSVCVICDKYILRDLTRHMRIHDEVGRFKCVYPRSTCSHKTGKFNRPYDYKKHLLRSHFKFDNPRGRSHSTLTDMLPLEGLCIACGARYIAQDWLNEHVLGGSHRCPGLVRE